MDAAASGDALAAAMAPSYNGERPAPPVYYASYPASANTGVSPGKPMMMHLIVCNDIDCCSVDTDLQATCSIFN